MILLSWAQEGRSGIAAKYSSRASRWTRGHARAGCGRRTHQRNQVQFEASVQGWG